MSTTAPDPRISTYNPVSPTTEFPATFPVFDNDDIKVFVDGVERDDFAISATYTEGISNNAKAVFAVGITGLVQIVGARDPHRTNRFNNGGPLPVRDLNLALDTIEAETQEARRDIDRSHKAPLGAEGGVFSADQIASAQSYAEMAEAFADLAGQIAAGVEANSQPAFTLRTRQYAIDNFHPEIAPDWINTIGRDAILDGQGRLYKRYDDEPSDLEDRFQILLSGSSLSWFADPFTTYIEVSIPNDFPTLQAAIDALSRAPMRPGQQFDLTIEDDHELTHGLICLNGNFGKFRIKRRTGPKAITGITKANPGVVTCVAHGYSNGQVIVITGVGGMDEVNGETFLIANATADTYTLQTLSGADVDTTAFTTYTSGGVAIRPIPIASGAGFTGVANTDGLWTMESVSARSTKNLFLFQNCNPMPILDALFDMNSPRDTPDGVTVNRLGHGIYTQNVQGIVMPNAGVIRAGMTGITLQNSQIMALNTIWNGAGSEGVAVQQCSVATFQGAYGNDCQVDNITAASNGAFYTSRGSRSTFQNGKALRSGRWAFDCHRATMVLQSGKFSSSGIRVGGVQDAGEVILDGATMTALSGVVITLVVQDGGRAYCQGTAFTPGSAGTVSLQGGGNFVNLYLATKNGGAFTIADVINVSAFNYLDERGMVVYGVNGPLSNFVNSGTFSATGASNGKRLTSATTAILGSSRNSATTATHQEFYNPNGLVGNITTSGTATAYNVSSDETWKNFIGELSAEQAIAVIKADPVREWNWKPEKGGGYAVGWGAQTSYSVSQDLATPGGWFDRETDEPVAEGAEGAVYRPWSVDQSKRTPYLWAAVSHLLDEVAALKARLDADQS